MSNTQWVGFQTLFRRETTRFFRIWRQTILPSGITSLLYILVFGVSLGNRIDDMGGFSYIQFILPGLVMMSVITNSFSNSSSSFFGMKFGNSIQELLVSPMRNISVVLAFILAASLRGIITGLLVLLIAVFFTNIVITNLFIVLFFMIFVAIVFSALGLISGMWSSKFDHLGIFTTFILTPLIYLGGVFYSINLLPPFWQTVSQYNPMLYFINGIRFGFLGISDVNLILASGIMVILAVGLVWLSSYLYKTGYKIKT